jgi:prepilin-type N-terminal cleavage/methylation domain-containing protein
MIEITTSNSTNVNELLFAFGNFRDEVMFMTMTTPTPLPFHQKNPRNKSFATDLRLQSKIQNQESKILNPTSSLNHLTPRRPVAAFTLIELLAVITIIGILAGLTLGAAGAVRRHGATSSAKAEVAALQAACDLYFADNNAYPIGTDDPTRTNTPAGATALFTNLLGSANLRVAPSSKRYFEPKPMMVFTNSSPNYFIDPWGYAYGYNSNGTNAPLIWSTAGGGSTNRWITSWPKM